MSGADVDLLRDQLRERGYLSHGIERWFALDPWRSRAFWLELAIVAAKGGLLIALFAVLPLVAVMLFRNHPLTPSETLLLTLFYGVTAFVISATLPVVIALVLRLRPQLAIDTPRALLGISFFTAALLTAAIAVWWIRFGTPPTWPELLTGLVLVVVFFLISTVAVSAALLSFSIYELKRIPALHRRSRAMPMTIAAAILIAALFLPTYAVQDKRTSEAPQQVVTTPTAERLAVIAVDGMTPQIFATDPVLGRELAGSIAAHPIAGGFAPERWASIGTGVYPALHGVRAVEGVRIRGGAHLIQSVSSADFVLRNVAEAAGLATREPLPQTIRRRDYVWEIFAARGVPSVAVNWWTTNDVSAGGLQSVNQEHVFGAALGMDRLPPSEQALRVDETASRILLQTVNRSQPRFATVYLPALDIILNRLALDPATKVALSIRSLTGLSSLITQLRQRGYDVVLAGMPGEHQPGPGILAWTMPGISVRHATAYDVAPTVCQLMGFPASTEMPGRTLLARRAPRIPSYGPRSSRGTSGKVDEEYYRSLRSLGYIR